MRRPAIVAALLALTVLTGCDLDAAADTSGRQPAAMAGRACQVIEYDVVATAIGVRFDTAGGAQSGETYTCVLGIEGKQYPDLTFAMSPTQVSALIFNVTVVPSGGAAVAELGLAAYQVMLPPGAGTDGAPSGPGFELGWLAASKSMMVLRYTFPATASQADIDGISAGVLALAKQIDARLGKPPQP